MNNLFHLAIPVRDLAEARQFYGDILGCSEGRSSDTWVDFNFYGHQLVTHCVAGFKAISAVNPVDNHGVPIPHFGIVLDMEQWKELSERLQQEPQIQFVIEPYIRFQGQPGEQATMFFCDPSGNALEFKAFRDFNQVFAK